MDTFNSIETIMDFAEKVLFPSHGLIIRPNQWQDKSIIFKGIQSYDTLIQAYQESRKHSADQQVWVETDMRAHMNPLRMEVISLLAEQLAKQLNDYCPQCNIPGWGMVDVQSGLPCIECGLETSLIKAEVFGCVTCDYRETRTRADGIVNANPVNCDYCNP